MNKPLILVVEDDTAIRNLITTTLETQDYRFHTAPNGVQALFRVGVSKAGHYAFGSGTSGHGWN